MSNLTDQDLGTKILNLRAIRGFSQRELARRAGITNGSLSQIEKGNVSPSVNTLTKLLDVLNVSLTDFFSDSFFLAPPVFDESNFEVVKTEQFEHSILHSSISKGRSRYLQRHVFQREQSLIIDWPEVEVELIAFLVTGELILELDGEVYQLERGQGFNFSNRNPHILTNRSAEDAELLIFVASY